nr:gpi mannosyltransferase 3 [Quercus suber]
MALGDVRVRHENASRTTSSTILVFAVLLAYRLINAFTIRTFFQPDEYFQSLEPAWSIAFGQGSGAWITWVRALGFKQMCNIDWQSVYRVADHIGDLIQANLPVRSSLLLGAPRIIQAIFAATGDFWTIQLASKIYGSDRTSVMGTLVLTMTNPWQWFCSVRTLSNSLETTLTVMGLNYWPWMWFAPEAEEQRIARSRSSDGLHISLISAAVACILRPTNIIIWATIAIASCLQSDGLRKATSLVHSSTLYGSAVLALSLAVDRSYYGVWTFPPLTFLYVNLVQSLAVFYGRNRVDYYFTEGLPLLLTTFIPLAGIGMYQALRRHRTTLGPAKQQNILFTLALAVLTTVCALTSIAHKEVRFIYPLLPLLHILAAKPLSQLYHSCSTRTLSLIALPTLAINCLIALYVTRIHQSGVIDVLHHIRHTHEVKLALDASAVTTVAFLMPCHSTPWRSHLIHSSIAAWALTCEPPLEIPVMERAGYMDEADEFYASPVGWVERNVAMWPEKVVMFSQLEPVLSEILDGRGYAECWRGFNTHWHDDWRRQGDVVVWCVGEEESPREMKLVEEDMDRSPASILQQESST